MADGASIAQGAKDKSLSASGDCPYCTRLGLPILPLRYAYPGPDAPKDKIVSNPDIGKCVYRILSEGYVYLYDKRSSEGWRCFAVTKDGYLREYPVDQKPAGQVTFQCKRKAGDNLVASIIDIRDPHGAGDVWIAYTSVWWTRQVRSQIEKAPATRMQTLHVPQLLGGTLPQGAFKVDPQGKSLVAEVAEYAGQADKFVQSTVPGIDRGKQAADQGKSMNDIMPGKAVAIPLYDAVGMAQEVRRYANAAQGKLAVLDQQYKRELWNDKAIQQLQAMFTKAGKSAKWTSDYQPKINQDKIDKFHTAYNQKHNPLITERDAYCADYKRLVEGDKFKCARDKDFDPDDGCSCRHFVQQMAEVLNSIGLNSDERKFALSVVQNVDDDNMWLRVLTANQKSLLSYIAKDQTSSLNDMGKNLYVSIDEWAKTSKKVAEELGLPEGQKLTPKLAEASSAAQDDLYFRWTLTGKEAVENAVQTTMLNLQTLATDIKTAGLRQMRIALFVGYLWVRVKFVPTVLDTTVAEELRRQKVQAWGMDLRGRISTVPVESGKSYSMDVGDVTDELGEAGHLRIRRVVIAWSVTVTADSTTTQTKIIQSMQEKNWVVEGGSVHVSSTTATSVATKTTTTTDQGLSALPKATAALEEENTFFKVLKEGGANATFCALICYFQVVSWGHTMESLHEAIAKKDKSAEKDAIAKLTSIVVATTGAATEAVFSLLPAIKSKMSKELVESSVVKLGLEYAPRMAALGTVMGGVAGIFYGFGTYLDGVAADKQGETTTGTYLELSGAAMIVGGLFSVAGGAAVYTATGTLLALGPGGWAVLAIGASVIAVVLLFEGEKSRSNPYQNWLRESFFGKDNALSVGYRTENDEATAFGQLFKLPLNVSFVWRVGMFGGNVDVDITAPVLGPGSWINYSIVFTTSDGQTLKGNEDRALGNAAIPSYGSMVTPSFKAREAPNGSFYSPRADGANWHLDWMLGQGSIQQVSVKLGYWPDKTHDPGIELPSAGGQTFNSTPKDGSK